MLCGCIGCPLHGVLVLSMHIQQVLPGCLLLPDLRRERESESAGVWIGSCEVLVALPPPEGVETTTDLRAERGGRFYQIGRASGRRDLRRCSSSARLLLAAHGAIER